MKKIAKVILVPLMILTINVQAFGQEIDLKTKQINFPVNSSKTSNEQENWHGDYVYFGAYEGKPIKFRVLDKDNDKYGENALLLDSDAVLFTGDKIGCAFDEESNIWTKSDVRTYLNTVFLQQGFSLEEQEALVKSDLELSGEQEAYDDSDWGYRHSSLDNDYIFVLDVSDVTNEKYGYPKESGYVCDKTFEAEERKPVEARKKSGEYGWWWLRSSSTKGSEYAGYVHSAGTVDYVPINCKIVGISPALNVSNKSILFTSLVDFDKTKQITNIKDDLPKKTGNEWKLTVLDNHQLFIVDKATKQGNKLTINYTYGYGGYTTSANQVSLMITDGAYDDVNSSMIYYGKISELKGGKATVKLPKNLDSRYKLYVFSEQVNEGGLTDYASVPVEIKIEEIANLMFPWWIIPSIIIVTVILFAAMFIRRKNRCKHQ